MRKSLLMIAAIFAALTINAKEVTVDLSKYVAAGGNATEVTPALADGVLTVAYDFTGEWPNGGVEFALANLDVTNLAFDYKGDASVKDWVSFQVYLKDSKGGLWYSSAADLSISEWNAEWASKSYMPSDVLWTSTTDAAPAKPFVGLGFLANPAKATKASFAIKNVKLTVADATAIDNTAVDAQTTKVIRDGQLFIIRNGVEYNANGQMTK